jgi:L-ascorbate metabolism protein UlaG (beta-lactamase superfamily)
MFEHMGSDLIQQVGEHVAPTGGLTFWWLGQHSFIVKMGGAVLYLDPYLSPDPARQVPPAFAPGDVTNADFILCSHDHSDHLDADAIPGLAAASPRARFVIPRPCRARMESLGVPHERLIMLDDGEVFGAGGLKITGVKAAHEFFDRVAGVGHPYMGWVVEAGHCAFYHSGDTLCYDGLLPALRRWRLTVAFLPINGRDAVRYRSGCIGNMTYQEAVDLAGLLQPRLVVPAHYDMFAGNSQDPQAFVDYLEAKFPGQAAWVGPRGQAVDVTPTEGD